MFTYIVLYEYYDFEAQLLKITDTIGIQYTSNKLYVYTYVRIHTRMSMSNNS